MHDERHDTCGKHIVVHVGVPGRPGLLKDVQVNIVVSNLMEMVGIGDGRTDKGSRVPELY